MGSPSRSSPVLYARWRIIPNHTTTAGSDPRAAAAMATTIVGAATPAMTSAVPRHEPFITGVPHSAPPKTKVAAAAIDAVATNAIDTWKVRLGRRSHDGAAPEGAASGGVVVIVM